METAITLGITLLLLVGVVWACSVFTNAIEWMGHRFKLSEGAVGSLLAAVGTALPETLVPIVALFGTAILHFMNLPAPPTHAGDGEHIGVGAILGAPFLLSTLAFFISGLAVYYFAGREKRGVILHLDLHLFKRDLSYFFVAYGLVFAASFIPSPAFKHGLAIFLLLFYAVYAWRTLQIEHVPDEDFHLEPLILSPHTKEPPTWLILGQVALSLLGILVMAHLFVQQISNLSQIFGISALLLSLIIAPIATELPEKFNSVVWLSRKKDSLALGNITGAMVFQSCIPTAVGLSFTAWILNAQGSLSVLVCFASAGLIYASVLFTRRLTAATLLLGGVFYSIFLVYSLIQVSQGG